MKNNTPLEASKALYAELSLEQPELKKIEQYLDEDADINYQADQDGYTPLMLAVDHDNESLVAFLIQNGANPRIKNKHQEIASDLALTHSSIYHLLKNNELLVATAEQDIEGVKAALAAGADVNYQGVGGYCALIIAVEENNLELVEILLVHGADKFLSRDNGDCAFFVTSDPLIYKTLGYGKPFSEEDKKELLSRSDYDDEERLTAGRLKTIAERQGQPFTLNHLKICSKAENFKPAPNQVQLAELEKHCSHSLPPILKELFCNYNGGRPKLRYFGDNDSCSIGTFYTVDENRQSPGNIWWSINNYSNALGTETLPFAEDSFGGVIYLKWVDGNAQVWLYQYGDQPFADEDDHNIDNDAMRITFNCLSNSLEEFLEGLYEAEE